MISSAEAQFQLFLMDEYIDISLAVLKHKLCWSFKVSTLQLPQNDLKMPQIDFFIKEVVTVASALKRPEPKPTYAELGFDDNLVRKLKEFNKADFDFYHRMNQTFWETVHVSKISDLTCSLRRAFKRVLTKWRSQPIRKLF